jgi:DNA-binding MarR family transcriptional regulator
MGRKSARSVAQVSHDGIELSGTGSCICFNVRKTARAVTQLYDAALRPLGLRSTQFAILVAVAKRGPIGVRGLGELLVTDPTTLSRSLSKLELTGHLLITPGLDRRERFVRLTRHGRSALQKSIPRWRMVQQTLLGKLSEPEWRETRERLDQIKNIALEASLEQYCIGAEDTDPKRNRTLASRGPSD